MVYYKRRDANEESCLIQNEPEREGAACWGLRISVQNGQRLSLDQIQAFLEGSDELVLRGFGSWNTSSDTWGRFTRNKRPIF